MVFCPKCGLENNDGAKFCKNCGAPLNAGSPIKKDYVATGNDPTARVSNSNLNNSGANNSKSDNKNLIIICLTIIICAVLIAGALIFFTGNNSNNDSNSLSDSASLNGTNSIGSVDQSANSNSQAVAKPAGAKMDILSGSISTGGGASDKTYCSIYVGQQYAGESVKISVLYSRDGSNLNNGNIVPKTVDSSGYISVPSASAFKYFPDYAFITVYDSNGVVLDTQGVNLNPTDGTQTF